jgi:S-adenosylmethionine:tRNA-ribosyltransferase-isomerase (queuine synthetase)
VDISLFHVISEKKQAGKKIVAVGTTVCRTLESLPYVWQSLDEEKKKEFDTLTRSYWDNLTETIGKEDFISRLSWDQTTQSLHFFTSIYIYPGKSLHVVDELITNFHLPESSLLVLVSSILGREKTLQLYEEAIRKEYRFFSFGDGMYIKTKEAKKLETCKNEKFEDRS